MSPLQRAARLPLPVVVLPLLIVGCAASASTHAMPAASPVTGDQASALAGHWTGAVTGPDIASATGRNSIPVRLEIRPDGTWTGQSESGPVQGRVRRQANGAFLLEGRVVGPAPGRTGAAISYEVRRRGARGLVGQAETVYQGNPVEGTVGLEKVS